ncbi:hypothetical protein EJ07DRAFT_154513 [Lizonia empirigonia]|nr:hypothetical protein EJ07DRAFT_154513 [Lizonia empirigonia]
MAKETCHHGKKQLHFCNEHEKSITPWRQINSERMNSSQLEGKIKITISQKQHNCASSQGKFVPLTFWAVSRGVSIAPGQTSAAGLGADAHSLSSFSSAVKRVLVPPGELNSLVDVEDPGEILVIELGLFVTTTRGPIRSSIECSEVNYGAAGHLAVRFHVFPSPIIA